MVEMNSVFPRYRHTGIAWKAPVKLSAVSAAGAMPLRTRIVFHPEAGIRVAEKFGGFGFAA